jgi:hypothetical protein
MRLEKEAPVTQLEIEVENILVNNGYNKEDIQFRESSYNNEPRYLRVGYWKHLSDKAIEQLGNHIIERVDMYDDDCGWLFCYTLNH